MKIISVYNMKGGVGKTTICVNLAYIAAVKGHKTLLLDLDPQGAASYYFRIRPSRKFNSKSLLKGGRKLDKAIKASDYENLDLIPASMSFRNLDLKLDSTREGNKQLKRILKMFKNEYDLIFIDSPPNISLISENIITASNKIIIPVIPTPLSVEAYRKMKDFLEKKTDMTKILPLFSMVDGRKKLHRDIMSEVRETEKSFLKNVIPYKTEFEKMGVRREPLPAYSKSSLASGKLLDVYNEIMKDG